MSTRSRTEAREQWARHRESRDALFDERVPAQQAHLFPIWYAAQNALRLFVGLDEEHGDEDGQKVIAAARQAGLLSLDDTHTLLDALGAATNARSAADGPAAPAAREQIQRGVRIIDRTIREDPLAPPPLPGAPPQANRASTIAAPPPLAMPAASAPSAGGSRTAWLVVGGAALLIASVAVGAFMLRTGARTATKDDAPAVAACRSAFDTGDRSRAQQACDAAAQRARVQPDHAIALVYLARLKRGNGDVQGAIADADLAQRLLPANGIALRELAAAFLDANDPGEARRAFVTAVQSDAEDRLAMAGLACALHRMGRSEEALRWRERAQRTAFDACLRAPAGR
jgi:tetratricopeptide (TPR) repeat protein